MTTVEEIAGWFSVKNTLFGWGEWIVLPTRATDSLERCEIQSMGSRCSVAKLRSALRLRHIDELFLFFDELDQ
ncbi:hypothetical protein D918_07597 [Trichuris suis]|nr:hypothetical protein D918_07597 [Trichuris suis]